MSAPIYGTPPQLGGLHIDPAEAALLLAAWRRRRVQQRRSRRRLAALSAVAGLAVGGVIGWRVEASVDAARDRAACEYVAAELGRPIASTCP